MPLFYSTNNRLARVTLEEAVITGLAPDGGLYMPEDIPQLPRAFIDNMAAMSLHEVAYAVIYYALQGDVPSHALKDIIVRTFNFDIPLVRTRGGRFVLELFHGPTMAFKDVGARFMARLLAHYHSRHREWRTIHVLVPTSGDTGSAVACSFLDLPGVKVHVLFPRGQVNQLQQAQFSTLGGNVTALEVNGSFDDCKQLVAQAFADDTLARDMLLTTATSINVARLLPQMVYYFYAYAQLRASDVPTDRVVVSVPCANLGNLVSGIMAQRMGLPLTRFVSAENQNNIFYNYLRSGQFVPRASVESIAPALDAGDPTNFPRVQALTGSLDEARKLIHGYSYTDSHLIETMRAAYHTERYLLDPHSAAAYRALIEDLQPGETGVALATAHPAKLLNTVQRIVGHELVVPAQLAARQHGKRRVRPMASGYAAFRQYLTTQQ